MTTPTISRLRRFICRAALLSSFLFSSAATRAAVANPEPFDFRQPDGTTVTVRLNGDEFAHWYTDLRGNRMVLQSDGFLRPATLIDDLKNTVIESKSLRREPKGIGISPYRKVPRTGNIKVLVMLVQFADIKFTNVSTKQAYINRQFNEAGFSSDGGTGSVRDYFVHQSGGAFTPQFVVHGPVTLSGNRATYAEDQYKMVTEGTALMDNVVNFSEFDSDSDGYVDVVMVLFAGSGANRGTTGAPWPHQWSVTSATSERFTRDGKTLALYVTFPELIQDYNPIYLPQREGIGTAVHEFSHALGLADHYNTNQSNDYTPNKWDVMDGGNYNNDANTPPNYNVFELEALDWLTPAILAEAANISLPSLNSRRYGVKIHTDRPGDYFLLENRTKAGFDAYLPGEGLLIWHIDASDESKLSNRPNVDNTHRRVDLIRADNEYTTTSAGYLGDPFPGSKSKTSFTSSTTPAMRRWNASTGTGTTAVNKPVTSIAKASNGTVTFKFMGGNASNIYSPDKALVYYTITAKPDQDRRGRAYIGRSGTATSGRTQKGDSIILRAVPATDYTFSHWTNSAGTRVGTSNPIRLIPSKTDTYTAVFTRNADAGTELCIPTLSTHNSENYISRLTFSASEGSIYVSPLQSSSLRTVYFDKTSYVLSVTRGERLSLDATATGHNTHTYIYIDRDADGFDYSTPADYVDTQNNYAPRAGSDLIYYSAWNPDGGTSWYSSTDGSITAARAASLKATDRTYFTIPLDLPVGTYTLRFKSQQCSLDPCGGQDTDTDSSHSLQNAGGIIVDIRLKVSNPPTFNLATGVRPIGAGTLEYDPQTASSGKFYQRFKYTVTAHANPGYRFRGWSKSFNTVSTKDSVATFSYSGVGPKPSYIFALFDPADTDPSDNPDYCQPEGTAMARYLYSLKAKSSSGSEIDIYKIQDDRTPSVEIYCDRTTSVLTAQPGATVTITPDGGGYDGYSHAYIYVDWDRNGFIYRDYNDYVSSLYSSEIKKGADLVYFSLHRSTSSNESYGTWYSSGGITSTDGDYDFATPCSFTIPADTPPGDYRIRFKRHWNSFDPCGLTEPEFYNDKTIEEMSGCVVDFTLRITDPTLVSVDIDDPDNGTAYIGDDTACTESHFSMGDTVRLHATANFGRTFIGWHHEGQYVSAEADYSFTLSETTAGSYTATFSTIPALGNDYCYPATAKQSNVRYIAQLTFTASSGTEISFTDINQSERPIYYDRTNTIFTVQSGDSITISGAGFMDWMHPYVFIDRDNDGFSYTADTDFVDPDNGYSLRPGSDLVYFSRYSPDEQDWYTSGTGKAISANFNLSMSADKFVIPSDIHPGIYRMRFMLHWNTLNPCGIVGSNTSSDNTIEKIGGNIIDFLVVVTPPQTPVIVTCRGNGRIEIWTDCDDSLAPAGTKIEAGSKYDADTELLVYMYPGTRSDNTLENIESVTITTDSVETPVTDYFASERIGGEYITFFTPTPTSALTVRFSDTIATITSLFEDPDDPDAPVQIFTVTGIPVRPDTLSPGVYIVRRGGKVSKILVR